ncbi:MAG: hypothetical protein HC772_00385 [Leptolyngbyaceae cyanobacterium CRU_2_3]|nr:hypothetical protein [Leptolyngbyaceae cyanobacterium CRU_2_3]
MSEVGDALLEFTEEVAEEIERAFVPFEVAAFSESDQSDDPLADWLDPWLQLILGFEATLDRATEPLTQTIEPLINQHPICIGCQNYHGQIYEGTMLVCAMHPYGIVDGSEYCPDKEAVSWSFPAVDRSNSSEDHDF